MEHLGPLVRDNGDLRWRSQVTQVSALLPASCSRKVIRPAALGLCSSGKALSQLILVCKCVPARSAGCQPSAHNTPQPAAAHPNPHVCAGVQQQLHNLWVAALAG